MIETRFTLKCSYCGAQVTFENEMPLWKKDPAVLDLHEKAGAWVQEHKEERFGFSSTGPIIVPREIRSFIEFIDAGGGFMAFGLAPEPDTRHINCEICRGKVYLKYTPPSRY